MRITEASPDQKLKALAELDGSFWKETDYVQPFGWPDKVWGWCCHAPVLPTGKVEIKQYSEFIYYKCKNCGKGMIQDTVQVIDRALLPVLAGNKLYLTSYDSILPLIQKQSDYIQYRVAAGLTEHLGDMWNVNSVLFRMQASPQQLSDALLVATGKFEP